MQCHLDEVDPHGVPDEIRHLAAGNPRGDLDHAHGAVVGDEQLREGDSVVHPGGVYRRLATRSASTSASAKIVAG